MVVRDDYGDYEAIDFREAAPAAAFEDMYQGNVNGSKFGGLAAGVPGEVAGLEYVHKKYGVSRYSLSFFTTELRGETDKYSRSGGRRV